MQSNQLSAKPVEYDNTSFFKLVVVFQIKIAETNIAASFWAFLKCRIILRAVSKKQTTCNQNIFDKWARKADVNRSFLIANFCFKADKKNSFLWWNNLHKLRIVLCVDDGRHGKFYSFRLNSVRIFCDKFRAKIEFIFIILERFFQHCKNRLDYGLFQCYNFIFAITAVGTNSQIMQKIRENFGGLFIITVRIAFFVEKLNYVIIKHLNRNARINLNGDFLTAKVCGRNQSWSWYRTDEFFVSKFVNAWKMKMTQLP